ncbi:MAG: DNA-directed RNA polymerase subunit RpoH/Rpb5 C-terminal domain-containing protein [Candidatus ainarchaeum sp.]|nr:DNA-directed RNA polymerase subunit RpoH/Rpb5 C-terminal domain-containing protein [Candidatus ainarchaeum sp.]
MKKKPSVSTVDVLSHMLVPEMKVIGDAEKTKLLSKFGINETQLPRISSRDPAAVALKAVPGNIIRIDRNDGTGKYTTYRVVVEE